MEQVTKVVFPYKDMPAAIKDRFKKLGGPVGAFRFMRKGYQELKWREHWQARARARAQEEDTAFAAAHKGGGTKEKS